MAATSASGLWPSTREHHVKTVLQQTQGYGAADACARAGDQGNPLGSIRSHGMPCV